MKWTTKDNKEIEISKMTDTHLLNTVKMLQRNAKKGVDIVIDYGYADEDDYQTGEIEDLKGEKYLNRIPEYKELLAEINKRKLTL